MRNQTSTERDRSPPSKKLRRFRRNSRGSAAVEFAIVAPLFFGLLFAIIA
jgi:Flp pilus assembly protein TadG